MGKAKEEAIREQTKAKVNQMVAKEWAAKKASLKLPKVDCEKPHKTQLEKLHDHIKTLEKEKAVLKLAPAPEDPSVITARLKSEVERNVRQSVEAEFDQKLSASKSAMKADMKKQIKKEKATLKTETARATKA